MRFSEITGHVKWTDTFWYEDSLDINVKRFISTSPFAQICISCADESERWAIKLKKQFPDKDVELVGGMFEQDNEEFSQDGHTWITIDYSIFDPTATQFDCYPNIDSDQYIPHETEEIN